MTTRMRLRFIRAPQPTGSLAHPVRGYRHDSVILVALCLACSLPSGSAQDPTPDATPFPVTTSVKGLQVQMTEDAVALGIRHAAVNVNLSRLLLPAPVADSVQVTDGTNVWHLNEPYARSLDQQVRPLSRAGIVVYAILLGYPTGDQPRDDVLLHPDRQPGMTIAGFNTRSEAGCSALSACVQFLAARYSGQAPETHGVIRGWITGNEVNTQQMWYSAGPAPLSSLARDYGRALRIVHDAVRRHSQHSRVYVSLDHHWTIRWAGGRSQEAWSGRDLLRELNRRIRAEGNFDWHVAYHPYPENLFDPAPWDDATAVNSQDTPRITFRNLNVLVKFLRRTEMQYDGNARRIILSEQGIHCPDGPNGPARQAAGFVYAWEQTAAQPEIDALIWHRHVDHAREGGLRLGLWERKPDSISTPLRPRPVYQLFRTAGTDQWDSVAQPYRHLIPARR